MGGSSKAQTVGYKYYLGMHAIMCHGPVDKVTRFSVDGKVAWSGTSTGGAVSVNAPQLFGGDEREGGVSGTIDIEMGTPAQGRNAYLQSQLGSSIPAFRRVLGLVFRQCYLGNNPYLKRWAIRATRILVRQDGIAQWYSAKADVGGDMNPAHIIREVLTDPDWGMGYPEADVDNASFTAAADTLYSEGMGMSILWDKQQQLSDFLAIVLRHIDGSLYTDRATGKFVIKLARGGYDIPSLLLLDESVVERVTDFKRSTVAELTNQVSVVYWDKSTGKNNSVTVQDIALAASQGATVGTTSQYPGFTNGTIATKAAARDLKALSTPLASATLYVTRKAASLNIGDVFRFAWAEYGISQVVFRVTNIELGELTSNLIKLSVVEDVFALSSAIYSPPPPSEWTNPIGAPVPVPFRLLTEVPYYMIARTLGDSAAQALPQTSSYMMVGGTNPGGSAYSAQVYVDEGAGYQQQAVANFCPTAVISAAYGQADTALAITGGLDLDLVQVGDVAAIGVGAISTRELVQVVSLTDTLLTVKRGMMDTVPVPVASNTRVIFLGSGDAPAAVELPNEYALGESVSVRMLTTTGQGTLALGSGATDTLAVNATAGRQWRPYPPGLFRVNGNPYPAQVSGYDGVSLTWAHRDRIQQTAQTLVDQNAASVGPEPGVTYVARVLNSSTSAVLKTLSGLTGTSATFTTLDLGGVANVRAEVYSVRSGVESLLRQYDEFVRVDENGQPIGPGFGTSVATEMYIYDGVNFIAGRSGYIGTPTGNWLMFRFYMSVDGGATFEYAGAMYNNLTLLSQQEAAFVKGSSFYLSFSKYYGPVAADMSMWSFATVPTLKAAWPPNQWTVQRPVPWIGSGFPLFSAWDVVNSRFVVVCTDKVVRATTDGSTWTTVGSMSVPFEVSGAWSASIQGSLFKVGSYWYMMLQRTAFLRSADLLTWVLCPGTHLSLPPASVAEGWQYMAPYVATARGSTIVVGGQARRNGAGGVMKEIALRSTDGLNFTLSMEVDRVTGESDPDFREVKPFGATGYVAAGPGGLNVSNDDGVSWARTVMANYPTALRANGANVVGSRPTAAGGANEPWYTSNGTTWTKSTIRNYNSGTRRYWRVRATGAAADVTFAELAFFNGATKHTTYTKSQGAGTGLASVDDNDPTTFWGATAAHVAAGTAWVAYDFASAVDVTAVELRNPLGDNTKMPTDIEVEASADGVNWVPVWFETGLSWGANENKRMEKTS